MYNIAGISICGDAINASYINESYKLVESSTTVSYSDYYHYMKIIGSINADSIHLIDDFENTHLFKNLTGEDLLEIAVNV